MSSLVDEFHTHSETPQASHRCPTDASCHSRPCEPCSGRHLDAFEHLLLLTLAATPTADVSLLHRCRLSASASSSRQQSQQMAPCCRCGLKLPVLCFKPRAGSSIPSIQWSGPCASSSHDLQHGSTLDEAERIERTGHQAVRWKRSGRHGQQPGLQGEEKAVCDRDPAFGCWRREQRKASSRQREEQSQGRARQRRDFPVRGGSKKDVRSSKGSGFQSSPARLVTDLSQSRRKAFFM